MNTQNSSATVPETQLIVKDSLEVTNTFNRYFINSVVELSGPITTSQPSVVSVASTNEASLLNLLAVNEAKINKILLSLSNS